MRAASCLCYNILLIPATTNDVWYNITLIFIALLIIIITCLWLFGNIILLHAMRVLGILGQ